MKQKHLKPLLEGQQVLLLVQQREKTYNSDTATEKAPLLLLTKLCLTWEETMLHLPQPQAFLKEKKKEIEC